MQLEGSSSQRFTSADSDEPFRKTDVARFAAPRRDRGKRLLDVVVAMVLLVISLPAAVLIAIAIKVDSPGPVFYRAERMGRRGQQFAMLKFRKMRDRATGLPLTRARDSRLTRVGAVLAKTKLDELPQLLNVIAGHMSLVGPRPEDPCFVEMNPAAFAEIFYTRPGITGLSQLAFANESAILDPSDPIGHYIERIMPQKIVMDRMYATQRTMLVDLRVVVWTLAAVAFRRSVAVHRVTGQMRLRRRP
ncbi:MAG: sugar transferase [Actinomycetota bacterium]|nr:sugar transferase [Actinomycetota bacterium]